MTAVAYTKYPDVDIAAHRSIARDLEILGFLLFMLGAAAMVYLLESGHGRWTIALGAAVMALGTFVSESASNMKIQALRWEVNDIHHGDDGDNDADEQLEDEG